MRNPVARDIHDPRYRMRIRKHKRREANKRACRRWHQSKED